VVEESQLVRLYLEPILRWLSEGGNAWDMTLSYWDTRRELMDKALYLSGPAAPILSDLDGTMDVFDPSEDRGEMAIDEAQMRSEVQVALARLRALGHELG
jgi:hypothetical protein